MSPVVVVAIELACVSVAHEARAALSGLGWQRHGRWCRGRAPSSAGRRRRPNFFQPYVTHMCILLTQRACRIDLLLVPAHTLHLRAGAERDQTGTRNGEHRETERPLPDKDRRREEKASHQLAIKGSERTHPA